MIKRILVATDGTALSDKAVADAAALAAQCGAELVIVTVVPSYPTALFEAAVSYSAEDIGRAEGQGAQAAEATLERATASARGAGIRVERFALHADDVAAAILAAAAKHRCGLVVMASHGRQGIRRLLLGSETQQVLARSSLPVLVVR